MFRNVSIRTKLIVIQSVTALTAVIVCSAIFVYNAIDTFKQSSISNKYAIAQVIGNNAASALRFKDQDAAKKILENLSGNASILNVLILDNRSNFFSRYDRSGSMYAFPAMKPQKQTEYIPLNDGKFIVSYMIIEENELLGTLFIHSEYTYLDDIIRGDIMIAGLISLLALAAAGVISFFLQRIISSRLLKLVNKTREVTETGNYATRVDVTSKDEIGILTQEFNNMLEQIEKRDKELEQRVLERTAELETSNKELESFSYSVSHDMRAPVRAISGYSKILSKSYSGQFDELGKEALYMVDSEAKRMGQLIDDLLAFSRLGKKELTKSWVNMTDLAKDAAEEVIKTAEVKNKVDLIIDDLPAARCDKNIMRQVFINLISNAVKYSQLQPVAKVQVGYTNGAYFVKDNGVGFDMTYYNKLFGVFQRLHTEEEFRGTGIGLAIVHKIITRHGGRIWASSEVNNGAVFYFTIPI